MAKWQCCCHGYLPHFSLPVADSDRCVTPHGPPESRGMTLYVLVSGWERPDLLGRQERVRNGKTDGKKERASSVTSFLPNASRPSLCNPRDVAGAKLGETFFANRPQGKLQGLLAARETPAQGLVMFSLSPYQPLAVRSVNPAPPPALGLLPINSISARRCQSLEENITSVIENAHGCILGTFPSAHSSLRVDTVVYMLSSTTLWDLDACKWPRVKLRWEKKEPDCKNRLSHTWCCKIS